MWQRLESNLFSYREVLTAFGSLRRCCSITQSSPTLCNPMDCSTPGLPVPYYLLEFAQVHVH